MMFNFLFPALLASASLTTSLAVSQNSPRADGSNYLIIPNDRFNTDDYESKLYKTVSEKSVYKSENCQLGVLFWSTKLSSSQANSLKDDSVELTNTDSKYDKRDDTPFDPFDGDYILPAASNASTDAADEPPVKRGNDITSQSDASNDMKVVSTPKGKSLSDQNAYRYKSSAGEGTTVYIVDTGFALGQATAEFPREKEYRFLYAHGADRGKTDSNGHGTWVASRIAGKKYGFAKKANLVFVKINTAPNMIWASVIDALAKISDDIEDNFVSKPVINLSWKLPGEPPGKNGVKDLKETMEYLELSNAVIVTSAGNEGKAINEYPAKLQPEFNALNVVGAVDNTGKPWEKSNTANFVKLYAPGVGLTLVGRTGTEDSPRDGTSYACAGFSGLAAYAFADLDSASAVNSKLAEWAYSRTDNGPKVIYNNVGG